MRQELRERLRKVVRDNHRPPSDRSDNHPNVHFIDTYGEYRLVTSVKSTGYAFQKRTGDQPHRPWITLTKHQNPRALRRGVVKCLAREVGLNPSDVELRSDINAALTKFRKHQQTEKDTPS